MECLNRNFFLVLVAVLVVVAAGRADAQGISFFLINMDPPNEGFNDPTLRTSDIDGQPTTLGTDRLRCAIAAMNIWSGHLDIVQPIIVQMGFEPLGGDASRAPLGAAGPETTFRDWLSFPSPLSETWFVVSQANQLAGRDLDPGFDDMGIILNVDIDGDIALGTTHWYYGVDGNPPPGEIDMLSTVLHELGHGMGFLTLMDLADNDMDGDTGDFPGGFSDIYTRQLHRAGGVNLDYPDMTDAQRTAANISNQVVWNGPVVVANQGTPQPMYTPVVTDPPDFIPSPNPASSIAHWDTSAFPNLLMEPLATTPFIDITLEQEAFHDMLWPQTDPLRVYVDFGHFGIERGSFVRPFNTLIEGVDAADPGATLFFEAGTSVETGVFSEAATWQSTGGTVRIGGF